MLIIGIDPGTATTGWGVIEKTKNAVKYLGCGCIKTPAKLSDEKRLGIIFAELTKIVNKFKPHQMALEKLYFGSNTKTAMGVGQARGVILLGANETGLAVFEYNPLHVKMAVTGFGRADKRQVQQMVKTLLNLEKIPRPDDAADALAIAMCHAHTYRF
ncbi:MAG: crossover junction endodeoxyribonuclease RuvC [Candidatus Margulisiibacteriota bacterium]